MSKKLVSVTFTFDDGEAITESFKAGCDSPLLVMERLIMPLFEACRIWKYPEILEIFDKDKSSFASEVGDE